MCFNFISYYPAMPTIDTCVSFTLGPVSLATCSTPELLEEKAIQYMNETGISNLTEATLTQYTELYTDFVTSG
ncbi:hypothetical protein HK101_009813 [Irineochytrium annulatum]|nr:hypothetical protein HK101_009813 [Irineochytrium annulatum]